MNDPHTEIRWLAGEVLKGKWGKMCALRKQYGLKDTKEWKNFIARCTYKAVGGILKDVEAKGCDWRQRVLLAPQNVPEGVETYVLVAVSLKPEPKSQYLGWISADNIRKIGPIRYIPKSPSLYRPVHEDQLEKGFPTGEGCDQDQVWFESLPQPWPEQVHDKPLYPDSRPLIGVKYPEA